MGAIGKFRENICRLKDKNPFLVDK